MLTYELLPYFTLQDFIIFQKLCKSAAHLVSSRLSDWKHLALVLAQNDQSDASDLVQQFKDYKEFKSAKGLFKLEGTDFTYKRYNQDNCIFDTLAYAGGDWPWKSDNRYF